jgi:hypothetical protein
VLNPAYAVPRAFLIFSYCCAQLASRPSRPKPCATEQRSPTESREARFVESVGLDAIEQSSPRSMFAIDLLTGEGLGPAVACADSPSRIFAASSISAATLRCADAERERWTHSARRGPRPAFGPMLTAPAGASLTAPQR